MFVNKHTSLIFWPKVCKKRFCPVLTWDSAAILQSFFQPQKLTGLQHSCPTSEWCQALISHSSKKHSSWQKCWFHGFHRELFWNSRFELFVRKKHWFLVILQCCFLQKTMSIWDLMPSENEMNYQQVILWQNLYQKIL